MVTLPDLAPNVENTNQWTPLQSGSVFIICINCWIPHFHLMLLLFQSSGLCVQSPSIIGIGYNINILQQTANLVINPITAGNFASLFDCTPVGQTSDSMVVPT